MAVALSLLALLAPFSSAQSSVSASSDRTHLSVGGTLQYRLEITGKVPPERDIHPPAGTGLELVQPEPTFRRRSRTGSQERLALEWTYQATRTGKAHLGRIAVPLGSRIAYSNPIDISVTNRIPASVSPSTPPRTSTNNELFVRTEPDRENAVIGQQLIVNYVLYFDSTLTPRETELSGTWDAPGFWKEELDIPYEDTYPHPVTIDGKPYRAVTIRRLALFPTRTGSLELSSMDFRVRLARSRRASDPLGGFFGSLSWDEEEATAPKSMLRIMDLPPGAPAGFNGAVGDFKMSSSLSSESAETGAPFKLRITLRGSGNIAILEAPNLNLPPSIERFPPAEEREINRTARQVSGSKSFEITLVPTEPGTLEIPPIPWSYYDPVERSYKTLSTKKYRVEVTGPALATSPENETANAGPRPLMARGNVSRPTTVSSQFLVLLLVGGLLLPLLIALGVAGARRSQAQRRKDSPLKRKKNAFKKARRALRQLSRTANSREQADYLEKTIRELIGNRIGRNLSTCSRYALVNTVEGILADETLCDLDGLLRGCEHARFSPKEPFDIDLLPRAKRLSKRIVKET